MIPRLVPMAILKGIFKMVFIRGISTKPPPAPTMPVNIPKMAPKITAVNLFNSIG